MGELVWDICDAQGKSDDPHHGGQPCECCKTTLAWFADRVPFAIASSTQFMIYH